MDSSDNGDHDSFIFDVNTLAYLFHMVRDRYAFLRFRRLIH